MDDIAPMISFDESALPAILAAHNMLGSTIYVYLATGDKPPYIGCYSVNAVEQAASGYTLLRHLDSIDLPNEGVARMTPAYLAARIQMDVIAVSERSVKYESFPSDFDFTHLIFFISSYDPSRTIALWDASEATFVVPIYWLMDPSWKVEKK